MKIDEISSWSYSDRFDDHFRSLAGEFEQGDVVKMAQRKAQMSMLDEIHFMLRYLIDRMPQPVINVDVGERSRNRNNRISKIMGDIYEQE